MDAIQKNLLEQVAELHDVPEGAYNIRANGKAAARNTTANIDIVSKEDKDGIDIIIKPGTKNESVHIPVVLSESGLNETVYNDFIIGDDCDVTIVAGCGIHNCGVQNSEHSGIHSFHVGKRARVRYVERHYGEGDGMGENIMNPTTVVEMDEDSYLEMETTQIKGVDSTVRTTKATLGSRATLIIKEKVMTHGKQLAKSDFTVDLNGEDCHTNVISRSVARDQSHQVFLARINGNARCYGHSECDAIIMDQGVVAAIPEVTANCVDASLVHEAAIGKIAGEQLIKLMTLGLTEKEAEEQIVKGFLKSIRRPGRGGRLRSLFLFSSGCDTIPEKSFEKGCGPCGPFILTTARCPNRGRWEFSAVRCRSFTLGRCSTRSRPRSGRRFHSIRRWRSGPGYTFSLRMRSSRRSRFTRSPAWSWWPGTGRETGTAARRTWGRACTASPRRERLSGCPNAWAGSLAACWRGRRSGSCGSLSRSSGCTPPRRRQPGRWSWSRRRSCCQRDGRSGRDEDACHHRADERAGPDRH